MAYPIPCNAAGRESRECLGSVGEASAPLTTEQLADPHHCHVCAVALGEIVPPDPPADPPPDPE